MSHLDEQLLDKQAAMWYNTRTDQGSGRGGFLFKSLHAHLQQHTVVAKAPVILGLPRAILVGSVGNQCGGGFVMDRVLEKRCSRCGEVLPYSAFLRNRRRLDGLRSECKKCGLAGRAAYNLARKVEKRAYNQAYYAAKHSEILAQKKEYYQANAEEIRAKKRTYQQANLELLREKAKRYHATHKQQRRAAWERWYYAATEQVREYRRKYRQEHLAEVKAKLREWQKRNPGRVAYHNHNRRIAKRNGDYTQVEWQALCEAVNHICPRCGQKRRLTVDHVVPLSRGGKNDITNIQPLCSWCNISKGTKIEDYRGKQA